MICSIAGAAEAAEVADEGDAERESAVCAEERTETDAAARAAMAGDALTGEFIRAGLSGSGSRIFSWEVIRNETVHWNQADRGGARLPLH